MDDGISAIERDVNAAIIDIAKDNGLDETEAINTLNTAAADMTAMERAQMLEALDGGRFDSIADLAKQIAEINEGQKRELDGKTAPSSE